MKLYGLIGYPLGHSFSVNYFKEKFSKEGIEAVYRNFPLKDIDEFGELVKNEDSIMGLNVTVPYKEKVIPFLDGLSQTARIIQAVNTICFCRRDNKLALAGHNTDVIGFERSLKEHLKIHHTAALVLGTGGSSKAIVFVLEQLGIDYKKVSRNRGGDRITYSDLTPRHMRDYRLIINTTPRGMHPEVETYPDIPYDAITRDHLLFDLVYNPDKTLFLSKGEKQGATIVNGYDMLVYQAEASWEIWSRKR